MGVVRRIEELAAELESLAPDLRPRPEVDATFAELVDLVLAASPAVEAEALADPAVQRLRPRLVELSAEGEHALERAWAADVASGEPLTGFPYLDHYRLLVGAELTAVAGRRPGRVLFVGSGPLPLSPMLMASQHGLTVDALDRDAAAVTAARRVTADVSFRVGDLTRQSDLAGYDLVVLAALVGDKRRCLAHLGATLRPGTLVLARSAHGLRTLLYPEVELPAGGPLRLVDVVHPPAPVINSIVVAEVSG